ncbi:hypothetical protein SAMN04488498_13217 [Mesorhizobium albiziae]|uniref:DUF4440 domain-containing protein n=1 Tax=Neomesorhizobium albiziae TaxID=335020 RepID=A0A1I4EYK2_9HYPH|nr:hypothetical protein [Mesorhizobium albiziae]GLS30689.1 hypothetical protein GCM10007937_23970 [Mesorhizobium albiziae]SFL10359.1 hypothetical protein SAMN04488498_13217 [Mesorhizobium albiziae]
MSAAHDKLLALEKEFWIAGEEFFRRNADKDCLVAFTEMAGVMSNADLAATAKKPNRWKELEIELKGIVEPTDGVVLLSYEASAVRENGEPYKALVSTGYVKRDDGWKMMFHAQAPLERRSQG